jgi:hypothetical protein
VDERDPGVVTHGVVNDHPGCYVERIGLSVGGLMTGVGSMVMENEGGVSPVEHVEVEAAR